MTRLLVYTPRGHAANFEVREDTCDHNNVWSCCPEDEYGTAAIDLADGIGVDIGAHIGGMTIPLALDNPGARIIAVEALSENVKLLQTNVDVNEVSDRVTVLHRAAAKPGQKKARVDWGFDGGESGSHHRFIGNAVLPAGSRGNAQSETVDCIDLAALVKMAGGHIDFLKTDIEGAEYDLLASPAVKDVGLIHGEYHAGWDRLVALLDATHTVTRTSGDDDLGGFAAAHR